MVGTVTTYIVSNSSSPIAGTLSTSGSFPRRAAERCCCARRRSPARRGSRATPVARGPRSMLFASTTVGLETESLRETRGGLL